MDNKLTNYVFDKIGVANFGKFLDLSSLRHKLVASNVANVSTSGYKARDIDFQAELNRATGKTTHLAGTTTQSNHLPLGEHAERDPRILKEKVQLGDLNSVDIDREVPKMAQNELLYSIGARLLEKKFRGLEKAITSK
jgi:flagellar basal-body rod protein FlgB